MMRRLCFLSRTPFVACLDEDTFFKLYVAEIFNFILHQTGISHFCDDYSCLQASLFAVLSSFFFSPRTQVLAHAKVVSAARRRIVSGG